MPDPAIPRKLSVVMVAGTMNPSIHHPEWYRRIDAINDDELAESLRDGVSATTPFVSRLQFGSPLLTIICQPNQWLIQSTDDGSWDRMANIASLAFAKANGPALLAYGMMVQRHIDTECDVKALLAARVVDLNLGFHVGANVNTNVTIASVEQGATIVTSVQSSVLGERVVFGSYHYDCPTREIEGILDGRIAMFISDSDKFFADITSAMNTSITKAQSHE